MSVRKPRSQHTRGMAPGLRHRPRILHPRSGVAAIAHRWHAPSMDGPICALLPAVAMALFAGTTSAQPTYPAKQLRLIVAFAPGGASDILSRALAQRLSIAFGQPVVI